jgi:hypothetical protein
MLIDKKHLSETNHTVSKDVVRSVFLANLENWRYVAFKELGFNLFMCRFIESASENPGAFLFTDRKMQEIFEERRRRDAEPVPQKATPNLLDQEFPQLAKPPPVKIPSVPAPLPQKSVASITPQSSVLPTPIPNFQVPPYEPPNFFQNVVNPFMPNQPPPNLLHQAALQQNLVQQLMLQQNQYQQRQQLQQNPFQQNFMQQNQMPQNMRYPPNPFQPNQFNQNIQNLMLPQQQQNQQNFAPPQCLVPQHFTPDAIAMPDKSALALDDFSSWKISRIITFARPKGEPLGIKSCYVCRRNFRMQIHFQEHMDTVHGTEFEIPMEVTMGK